MFYNGKVIGQQLKEKQRLLCRMRGFIKQSFVWERKEIFCENIGGFMIRIYRVDR